MDWSWLEMNSLTYFIYHEERITTTWVIRICGGGKHNGRLPSTDNFI